MTSVSDARIALEAAVTELVRAYMRGSHSGFDNAKEREAANKAQHDAVDKLIDAAKDEGAREDAKKIAAASTVPGETP